jgi:hypothetical protein
MADVEPFDKFLARTACASHEAFLDTILAAPGAAGMGREEAAAEFRKMKAYVLDLYRGVTPVRSVADASGNVVDCIPFHQHPSVRAAEKAGVKVLEHLPPPPRLFGPHAPAPAAHETQAPCPEGSRPLRRVTLELMARSGPFDQFFHKHKMDS